MRTEIALTSLLFLSACGLSEFTLSQTGCACHHNISMTSCACCKQNGCQCPLLTSTSSHKCVECGSENTCPSDQECDFINSEGCFFIGDKGHVYTDAGISCANQDAVLSDIKTVKVWEDVRECARKNDWAEVWTGARIRDFDWQWSKTCNKVLLQGCFADKPYDHVLPYVAAIHENVTAENCLQACRNLNFSYASVQYETVSMNRTVVKTSPCCRCGDIWRQTQEDPLYSERPLEECSAPCVSAEHSDFPCGSHNKQLVFTVNGHSFEAWNKTQVSDGHCAVLDVQNQEWLKMDCKLQKHFICEYPALDEPRCDGKGHSWVRDRCVNVNNESQSWHEATQACAQDRGFLIQLDNKSLQEGLTHLLAASSDWWIGLTNRQLTWSDGSAVTYMPWSREEPDFTHEGNVCAELRHERRYRAKMEQCTDVNNVICQSVYNFTKEDYDKYVKEYQDMGAMHLASDEDNRPRAKKPEDPKNDASATSLDSANSESHDNTGVVKLGVGIGVSAVLVMIIIFGGTLFFQRRYHKRKLRKSLFDGGSYRRNRDDASSTQAGFFHARQESIYDKIDDTYERPEPSVSNSIPPPHEGLNCDSTVINIAATADPEGTELCSGLSGGVTTGEVRAGPEGDNVPEPPPRREEGYASLETTDADNYTTPCPYTGLFHQDRITYTGLLAHATNEHSDNGMTTTDSDTLDAHNKHSGITSTEGDASTAIGAEKNGQDIDIPSPISVEDDSWGTESHDGSLGTNFQGSVKPVDMNGQDGQNKTSDKTNEATDDRNNRATASEDVAGCHENTDTNARKNDRKSDRKSNNGDTNTEDETSFNQTVDNKLPLYLEYV